MDDGLLGRDRTRIAPLNPLLSRRYKREMGCQRQRRATPREKNRSDDHFTPRVRLGPPRRYPWASCLPSLSRSGLHPPNNRHIQTVPSRRYLEQVKAPRFPPLLPYKPDRLPHVSAPRPNPHPHSSRSCMEQVAE